MPIRAELKPITIDRDEETDSVRPTDRWWTAGPAELAASVWATAEHIRENNALRSRLNYLHHLMYDDIDINQYIGKGWRSGQHHSRCILNVVRAGIDTAASMIASERPEPVFLSDGAEYGVRVRTERTSKYVNAVFEDCGINRMGEKIFTHAGIWGLGALFLWGDEAQKRIRAEVCHIEEIIADEVDGLTERPTQLHRRKLVSKSALIERFGDTEEKRRAIRQATSDFDNHNTVSDSVYVVESWHLPSGPKAKDGVHCIVIEKQVLLSEPYTKKFFPIVFFRWMHKPIGFYGRGIAQEIGPIQRELNYYLRTVSEAHRLIASPAYLVEVGSLVRSDQLLNNTVARRVDFTGTPPQVMASPILAPEVYTHIWTLKNEAFNQIGINQQISQGQKPNLGPNASGSAIRESTDIAQGRLKNVAIRWEDFHVEIARLIVSLSADLAERVDLEILAEGKNYDTAQRINWKECQLEESKYTIDVFEGSGLPRTPAGRLQAVSEYLQNGLIEKDHALKLLDFPDLRSETDLDTATVDEVDKQIERIKEKDEWELEMFPIPEMNLPQAFDLAHKHMVRAKYQGLPDSVLAKIGLYIQKIDQLQKEAAQPGPQPGAGPMGPPPGAGGPPGPPQGGPPPPMPPGPPGPPSGAPPQQ